MTAPGIVQFARVVSRYARPGSDAHTLLSQLASPEHQETRWGWGDHTFRGVLADALDEEGGHHPAEGELLREPGRHVVVHNGHVYPAAFTLGHLGRAVGAVQDHLDAMTGGDHDLGYEIWPRDHSPDGRLLRGGNPGYVMVRYQPVGEGGADHTYHVTEARPRIAADMARGFGIDPTTPDWEFHMRYGGGYEEPNWRALRRRVIDVRDARIEHQDTRHPAFWPITHHVAKRRS